MQKKMKAKFLRVQAEILVEMQEETKSEIRVEMQAKFNSIFQECMATF